VSFGTSTRCRLATQHFLGGGELNEIMTGKKPAPVWRGAGFGKDVLNGSINRQVS